MRLGPTASLKSNTPIKAANKTDVWRRAAAIPTLSKRVAIMTQPKLKRGVWARCVNDVAYVLIAVTPVSVRQNRKLNTSPFVRSVKLGNSATFGFKYGTSEIRNRVMGSAQNSRNRADKTEDAFISSLQKNKS